VRNTSVLRVAAMARCCPRVKVCKSGGSADQHWVTKSSKPSLMPALFIARNDNKGLIAQPRTPATRAENTTRGSEGHLLPLVKLGVVDHQQLVAVHAAEQAQLRGSFRGQPGGAPAQAGHLPAAGGLWGMAGRDTGSW
jgi:hypothetical protein